MSIPVPPQQTDPAAAFAPHPGAESPYPAGAPYLADPTRPHCRFCGSVPAVDVTVRGHQGFLVMMRFLRLPGPFCRDCGTATVRRMTANSLWQGWWGLASALINPFTMLMNLVAWSKLRKLAPPAPGAPGTPLPVGRPLYLRPAILGLLVPVVAVGAIVYSVKQDPDFASAGDCVHKSGSDFSPDLKVVDCGGSDAQYKVLGRVDSSAKDACAAFPTAEATYWVEKGSSSYSLCLVRIDDN
ncbi:LppU/SCO3897 family protein [Kitasatospora phosalacinea]|uniref:Toxin-antitoxin system, toxin component n=1 Tax=Kitasatospora phosalacinea TaxID=2065 RepID=A0A9W6URZ9_9ACTN|nr:hypothetical protein [Kitasatospora phosalacinea]GLW58904.1 hypothetical protein Kpho01_69140 [Kitasatospora phosalacinea]